MPAADSPAIIVARFLKSSNYNATLDAFIKEAGLPPGAENVKKGDLTIEKILEEKKIYDTSVNFERFGVGDGNRSWTIPAPSSPTEVSTLPTSSNLLHVAVESSESVSDFTGSRDLGILVVTTADRRLSMVSASPDFKVLRSYDFVQDSPILSCLVLSAKNLVTISTGMSGQVILYDHSQGKWAEVRRDHQKYVVKVIAREDSNGAWVVTAGWDAKVLVYRLERNDAFNYEIIGSPVACLSLSTNPETLLFASHPDGAVPVLIVTRRDSTLLYYYRLPSPEVADGVPIELNLLGTQNLAPHSNAWIAFSPSSIALCPTDPTLLAVATSAVPHMKLIIVRLLFPPLESASADIAGSSTQAAQTRTKLAAEDREDTAILVHSSTLAPQTPYSTPQVAWRPNGSGVWVNGDDGVLRGIEAKTGKIIATLKGGHEPGSKIRSIWAGYVGERGNIEEWVVSGGFDRKLVVWRVDNESNTVAIADSF